MKNHFDFLMQVFDINSVNINGVTKKLDRRLADIDDDKKCAYLYRLITGDKQAD